MKWNNWLILPSFMVGFGYITSLYSMYPAALRRGTTRYQNIYRRDIPQQRPGIQPRPIVQEQPSVRSYQTSYRPQFWGKIKSFFKSKEPQKISPPEEISPIIAPAEKPQTVNTKEIKEAPINIDKNSLFNILNFYLESNQHRPLKDLIELLSHYKNIINATTLINHPIHKNQNILVTPLDLILLKITKGHVLPYGNIWLFDEKRLDEINLAIYLMQELGAFIAQTSNSSIYTDIYPLIINKYQETNVYIDELKEFLDKLDVIFKLIAPTFNTKTLRAPIEVVAITKRYSHSNSKLSLDEAKTLLTSYKPFINSSIKIKDPFDSKKYINATPLDFLMLEITYEHLLSNKWFFLNADKEIELIQFLVQTLQAHLANKENSALYTAIYPLIIETYKQDTYNVHNMRSFLNKLDGVLKKIAPEFNTQIIRDSAEIFIIINEFLKKDTYNLEEIEKILLHYKPFINNFIIIPHPTAKNETIRATPLDLILLHVTYKRMRFYNKWRFYSPLLNQIKLAQFLIQKLNAQSFAQIDKPTIYTGLYPHILESYLGFDSVNLRAAFKEFLDIFDSIIEQLDPTFKSTLKQAKETRKLLKE